MGEKGVLYLASEIDAHESSLYPLLLIQLKWVGITFDNVRLVGLQVILKESLLLPLFRDEVHNTILEP
jgi:hypothetical protein